MRGWNSLAALAADITATTSRRQKGSHGAVHKVRHTRHIWLSHGIVVVEKMLKLRSQRSQEITTYNQSIA